MFFKISQFWASQASKIHSVMWLEMQCKTCRRARVVVCMVTGNNMLIVSADVIATEGWKFRKMSRFRMNEFVCYLKALARASPEDKRIRLTLMKDMEKRYGLGVEQAL
jgi:hypothetical protein